MGPDGDEPELRFVETAGGTPPADGNAEVIGTGPPGRHLDRRWLLAGTIAVALALGIAIGFASGRHGAKGAPAPNAPRRVPTPTSATPSFNRFEMPTLTARCAAQSGKQLQLGIEITNPSALPLTIDRVQPVLPLGGLRARSITRDTCGELPALSGGEVAGYDLAAGASVWITMEMDVLVSCPAPLPVQVRLGYSQSGHDVSVDLSPFSDLGEVPYTGCPTN